jgi:hypothetical protein
MTSQINYAAIDATYPIAGQDNDSQGFRDNFSAMQAALVTAKTEITELQDKAILKTELDNGLLVDDPQFNNLNDNVLHTGSYFNFFPRQVTSDEDGSTTMYADVDSADFFAFTGISASGTEATLSFRNWPSDTQIARVRVHLEKNPASSGTRQVVIATNGGSIVKTEDFPPVLTLTDNVPFVIEAWTYNGGSTVYVAPVGKFTTPTNNRDIVGNLSVQGDTEVVQLDAASITVSGVTDLGETVVADLTVTNDATVNGNIEIKGTTTLGNAFGDTVSFVGIPKLPVLSTTQRNALTGVQVGMLIYNETGSNVQICTAITPSVTWTDLN